jgi:hypothetical protein
LIGRRPSRWVNIDPDFQSTASRTAQRLDYRFDGVAAVRINGLAT